MTHVEHNVFTVSAPPDLLLKDATLPLAVLSCDCSVNTFTGIIPRVVAPHDAHYTSRNLSNLTHFTFPENCFHKFHACSTSSVHLGVRTHNQTMRFTLVVELKQRTYLHFLQDDALSVRCTTKGVSLPPCAHVGFFKLLVSPSLLTAMVHVLTRCAYTTGFTWKICYRLSSMFTSTTEIDTPYI